MNPKWYLSSRICQLFYDDEGAGGLGDIGDIPHGSSGDVAIMGLGDKEDAEDPAVEKEDEADPEEKEDKEVVDPEVFDEVDEEEGDGEKEEKEEKEDDKEEPFQGRPTLTDIKTKYPKIFKDFPDLREVLFREQEFGKHFGTVEEAQEASVKAQSFNVIEASLLGGDASPIIDQLAENAPEALNSVIDNFLPTLLKKSNDLYLRATVPVIEQFLHSTYEHGKKSGDKNLMLSAQHAANFIFGKPEIPDPARRGAERGPHPAEQKLEQERNQWAQTRFKEASSEVSAEIDTELESDILKGLDPDKKLSDRQRTRLIQDIKDEIDSQLGKDSAFGRQMKSLWDRAKTANYPKEQRASIKSAFLARAKALVPSVRTRLRAEWFGEKQPSGGGKADPKDKKTAVGGKKRTLESSGRSSSQGGTRRAPDPKDVDYSRTSDEDLIAGRFTRKR